METPTGLFRVRTATAFITLRPGCFPPDPSELSSSTLDETICGASKVLRIAQKELVGAGYEVQTIRIATNPFENWLLQGDPLEPHVQERVKERLRLLDLILAKYQIQFCALGPSESVGATTEICPIIVESSPRLSCSAIVHGSNVEEAEAAANCILTISRLGEDKEDVSPSLQGGMGNFRFCATASCPDFIPFFPAARSSETDSPIGFVLGLENGALARQLLQESKSIQNIGQQFRKGMTSALLPVQSICDRIASLSGAVYLGIDSSLNPSLEERGSVAAAIETLDEIQGSFGKSGTLAAAAAITTALQSLPGIKTRGYCGLMLPVCEDRRLAQLASIESERYRFKICDLLNISSVCGVGVDTVPISGTCSRAALTSLILDVAALADRWSKGLSCRVFPVPGKTEGAMTEYDSPYLCNSLVFGLP